MQTRNKLFIINIVVIFVLLIAIVIQYFNIIKKQTINTDVNVSEIDTVNIADGDTKIATTITIKDEYYNACKKTGACDFPEVSSEFFEKIKQSEYLYGFQQEDVGFFPIQVNSTEGEKSLYIMFVGINSIKPVDSVIDAIEFDQGRPITPEEVHNGDAVSFVPQKVASELNIKAGDRIDFKYNDGQQYSLECTTIYKEMKLDASIHSIANTEKIYVPLNVLKELLADDVVAPTEYYIFENDAQYQKFYAQFIDELPEEYDIKVVNS